MSSKAPKKLPAIGGTNTTTNKRSSSNSGGSPLKKTKSMKRQLTKDVKVQDWNLPNAGTGPYKSSTYAIRESIRMKMEAVRENEQRRNEFEDYCYNVNKARQGERQKAQQTLLENAKANIRSFSPELRHAKTTHQGQTTDIKVEEARRKKLDAEMEWYHALNTKCEATERRHENYHATIRQVELLRSMAVANSVAIFGGELRKHWAQLQATSAMKKKGKGSKSNKRATLGAAMSGAFEMGIAGVDDNSDLSSSCIRAFTTTRAGLIVWLAAGKFCAIASRVRRRMSVQTVRNCLVQIQKSSQVARALQSFFYRVRNAQRISKNLVRVIRMREKLVEVYWEREERRQIHDLLQMYQLSNRRERSLSMSTKTPQQHPLRSPSVHSLSQRSPSNAGLLPPLGGGGGGGGRRMSNILDMPIDLQLQQEDSLADPYVWRPRQSLAPVPGANHGKRHSVAPQHHHSHHGESPLQHGAQSMTPDQMQHLLEVGAQLKDALSHGVPIPVKRDHVSKYIQHMRRVNLATMSDYSLARNKFMGEKERLQMLVRRQAGIDPITGKVPEEELLLLTKPQKPLIMCLPKRSTLEAHVAFCIYEVIRRVPNIPAGSHSVTSEHKVAMQLFDQDVKSYREKKEKRTKSLLKKKKLRDQDEEDVHGFEFPFARPR